MIIINQTDDLIQSKIVLVAFIYFLVLLRVDLVLLMVVLILSNQLLYKRNISRPFIISIFDQWWFAGLLQAFRGPPHWFQRRIPEHFKIENRELNVGWFSNAITGGSSQLEEEYIELTTNEELNTKFKNGYQVFWLQEPSFHLILEFWKPVKCTPFLQNNVQNCH